MKTIVALRGEDVKNPQASAIEEFIVTQTGASRPKGLLIPTALQKQGTGMSGVSAGAICWFTYGSTDSTTYEAPDPTEKLVRMSALGFVHGLFSPHHTTDDVKVYDELFIKEESFCKD